MLAAVELFQGCVDRVRLSYSLATLEAARGAFWLKHGIETDADAEAKAGQGTEYVIVNASML